jgi:predicted transposase YbfD/YdcC
MLLAMIFSPRQKQERNANLREAETCEKGHGRVETRRLQTLTKLPSQIDFPGAKQICRIERTRALKGSTTVEVVFAVTSLTRLNASADALQELARQHWTIENKLHWTRDVTMGEDHSTVCSGHAPQALAALRNAALFLIRAVRCGNVAKAARRYAARPREALALVRGSPKDF